MTRGMAVAVVTDAAALEALAPAWRDLWALCPEATPFQSPDWLVPWWRAFAPGALATIAVWRGGRLVGLAPFYGEPVPGGRLVPLGVPLSDHLDVLLDPEHAEAAAVAMAGPCGAGAIRWTSWCLEELAPGAAALRLPCPAGSRERVRSEGSCPVLPLAGAGEELRGVVPARKRRKLRMARARARRRGGFAARAVAPADLETWLTLLFRLHAARWQDRGEAGVLADAAVRRFHRAAAPRLMAAGLLRAWVVTIGGIPAGAYYGLHHRERACAYLGGFDPAFAAESPGTILIGHAIEQALREGAREFDFLRGREPYKYEWGAADRWSLRRSFRRPGADAA